MHQGARQMKVSELGRCALSSCVAAAWLAACGGSQPPIGALGRSAAAPLSVAYNVIYSFKGGTDGEAPLASLIYIKGTLYGTTVSGGGHPCTYRYFGSCGTVFSITPSGVETVLHAFGDGTADGANPVASLLDVHGAIYGTTAAGGAKGRGTVFALTTSGAEIVLHSFGGTRDGKTPEADLVLVNNLLYGTTALGGGAGYGTVFTITPKGKEDVLYQFQSRPDAEYPIARFLNVNGTLYSTTENGGHVA
jgi:uncharacterized repeat protein (TIGR03803 family)